MLSSLSLIDEYVVQRTSGLVAYLKELVEQSSEQVRDTADDGTVWLYDYQEHFADEGAGELLEIRCPPVAIERITARGAAPPRGP